MFLQTSERIIDKLTTDAENSYTSGNHLVAVIFHFCEPSLNMCEVVLFCRSAFTLEVVLQHSGFNLPRSKNSSSFMT